MHIPAEKEFCGRRCRPGPGAAGTSLCKRSRAGSGIEDSSLQKPVPDGELGEIHLICALPKKPTF